MKKLLLVLLLAACSNEKFEIGINAGPAGADVGHMAASEIRQSRPAKDRRIEVRIAAARAVALGTITGQMLGASLDSMAESERVGVVISRFGDHHTLEAARRFKAQGVPFLSLTPLPTGITSGNGPGFSMVPGYTKQGTFLAAQAKPNDRVAIIHIDDAYGAEMTKALVAALAARGLKPIEVKAYQQSWDEPRMVALGSELQKTKDPTLVYFLGRAPSLELVWQPFREVGSSVRVVGSDLVESTAVYANNEGRFTGLRYVRYLDPKSADKRIKDLNDRYWMWASRGEMTGEAVMVYDAAMIVREALAAGARTRPEMVQYFASLGRSRPPYNGVGGPVAFDATGEIDRKMELAEVTRTGILVAADSLKAAQ